MIPLQVECRGSPRGTFLENQVVTWHAVFFSGKEVKMFRPIRGQDVILDFESLQKETTLLQNHQRNILGTFW